MEETFSKLERKKCLYVQQTTNPFFYKKFFYRFIKGVPLLLLQQKTSTLRFILLKYFLLVHCALAQSSIHSTGWLYTYYSLNRLPRRI